MSTEVFYRVHDSECAPFSADNAWSSVMGLGRKPGDLSKYECECTVTGDGPAPDCTWCEGTGWSDCMRGYSCCGDAESLIAYFSGHAGEPLDSETVVIFEGHRCGNDPDGEALAIPERLIETLTWAEFTAREAL